MRAGVALSVDCTTGIQFPAEAKDFFLWPLCPDNSQAHLASHPMVTRGPFRVAKRGRGVTLTTHAHLVQLSRTSRSYASSALAWRVVGQLSFFFLQILR
jgi:hypothetical protein